jgi:hypothetical protein
MKLFDLPEQQDLTYTTKVGIPQYLPSQEKPDILQLCDERKVLKLIDEINASNVTPEEKKFLIKAASRHYVFNYSRIADYYAHANKEMQELMEKSALVLIDMDDAIANGYVELSDFIKNLMETTGKHPALDDKLATNQANVEDGDLEDQ